MPAKKLITRETILDAAFDIVRSTGMEGLNMRSLAKKCNCSTQPIYLSFSGAEQLKQEVTKKITDYFDKFIQEEIAKGQYPEYKCIGIGYIKFAKAERQLFRYLFMRERNEDSEWEKKSFNDDVFCIMKNYGLYRDDACKLHAEMWIFVHGIAVMYATKYLDWNPEEVSEMVTDVYNGLTAKLRAGENK